MFVLTSFITQSPSVQLDMVLVRCVLPRERERSPGVSKVTVLPGSVHEIIIIFDLSCSIIFNL